MNDYPHPIFDKDLLLLESISLERADSLQGGTIVIKEYCY
ncbi:MAG: hypothetical protein ACJAXN_001988 [Psychromonas sp.]|jgi:hypothetical protein